MSLLANGGDGARTEPREAFVQRSPGGIGPALFSAYARFRSDAPCAREQ